MNISFNRKELILLDNIFSNMIDNDHVAEQINSIRLKLEKANITHEEKMALIKECMDEQNKQDCSIRNIRNRFNVVKFGQSIEKK